LPIYEARNGPVSSSPWQAIPSVIGCAAFRRGLKNAPAGMLLCRRSYSSGVHGRQKTLALDQAMPESFLFGPACIPARRRRGESGEERSERAEFTPVAPCSRAMGLEYNDQLKSKG